MAQCRRAVQVIRNILLLGHRQAFTWIDEWYGKYTASMYT